MMAQWQLSRTTMEGGEASGGNSDGVGDVDDGCKLREGKDVSGRESNNRGRERQRRGGSQQRCVSRGPERVVANTACFWLLNNWIEGRGKRGGEREPIAPFCARKKRTVDAAALYYCYQTPRRFGKIYSLCFVPLPSFFLRSSFFPTPIRLSPHFPYVIDYY